jgi:serine protease inhibitor
MKARQIKRKMSISLSMVTLVLLLGATTGSRRDRVAIPDISKRINAFTCDLLKHNAGIKEPSANTILSAQSIFHGLAMSYIASAGATRKELAEVLHFPGDNRQLIKDLSKLRGQMKAASKHKKIEFNMANAAWVFKKPVKFRQKYLAELKKGFSASVFKADSNKKGQVCKSINDWASKETHGKIREVIKPEDLTPTKPLTNPALVTLNVVYFNGDWESRFDQGATRPRSFRVDASRETEAMMMHQCSRLPYAENDSFKLLALPYLGRIFSMYVILPKELLSIKQLMALANPDAIFGLKDRAFARQVDVLLPKFIMKSHSDVKEALSQMGVKTAFDRFAANFDKMIVKTPQAMGIYISRISHDGWIEVDEQGTEAAAATTIVHFSMGCSAAIQPQPKEFHADQPFLFMIVHNQSRSIIFAGWFSDPDQISK